MENLDTTLSKWAQLRKQKVQVEKECTKYKNRIERYMNSHHKTVITGTHYSVQKQTTSRKMLLKESTPIDLWDTYSVPVVYNTFRLKENKKVKVK